MSNTKPLPSLPGAGIAQATIARLRAASAMLLLVPLAACKLELLTPQGDIGAQEKNLILLATGIMLLVVIPVIALTLYFAWRYRAGRNDNNKDDYAPTWSHSTKIEVVVWSIPCIIVAFLAVLIWDSTHALDPYKPIESKVAPLEIEVVALNWKWLFIYPEYGIASVNQLAIPVDRPVSFKLTAASIMNSFFIPQLGSQVYAMAGMQTKLHLIANQAGTYHGLSAAYSGAGFSDMKFDTIAGDQQQFDAWIRAARQAPQQLDQAAYQELEQDSINDPVKLYARVEPGLFDGIVNQYMKMQGIAMAMGMTMPAEAPATTSAAPAMPATMAMPVAAKTKITAMHHHAAQVTE